MRLRVLHLMVFQLVVVLAVVAAGLGAAGSPAVADAPHAVPAAPPPQPTADSPGAAAFRPVVDTAVAQLAAQLGVPPLTKPPFVEVLDEKLPGGGEFAHTWSYGDPVDTCLIQIQPKGQSLAAVDTKLVITHEVVHCYQDRETGNADLPAWIAEGTAMWAGAQLAPASKITKDKWAPYLASTTKGLFGRTYDAIGFFGHLEDVGVDVWHRILPMTTEASSAGAFDVATGGSATAIDDWPSGLAREPAFGPAWETGGPDIPAVQPPRTKGNVANGTSAAASVGKAANAVVDLDLSADVVIVDATPTARGHLRDAAGTDQLVATVAGRTFCANPNGCACPEGSSGAGIQLAAIAPGKGVLAVTGGTATAKVTVQGKSLADFCKHPTTVDPCVVGTWIGTGVTLDIPSASIAGSGGAGAVLKLAKNGSGSVDMNPSAPVTATIPGGLTTAIKLNGGATGVVSAKNGVMTTLATTSSSITFSVDVAGLGSTTLPFSGGSGPPFDGAYTCTKTTLTYTAVGLGGQSTWDRA